MSPCGATNHRSSPPRPAARSRVRSPGPGSLLAGRVRRLDLVASAVALMVLGALMLAGCGGAGTPSSTAATAPGEGFKVVTPQELSDMLKNKDFLMVNVHIPYEGEIEPTDLFLPYDQAAQLVDRLPQDKSAKIVVYCRSGRMSRIAVQEWVKAGYTNLYDLEGGFQAWEAAGYPLAHKPQ